MTPTPDPTGPVLTVARWSADDVELVIHRTDRGTTVTRPGETPVVTSGDVADALRAHGELTLRDDDQLFVAFDDRAGLSADDVLAVVREHSADHVPDDSDFALVRTLGHGEPLLTVGATDYAVLATPDGFEFVAVTGEWDEIVEELFSMSACETGSMCGGWSRWRLGRLPSGTLVRFEQINEFGGTFEALDDSRLSDLDAVAQYFHILDDNQLPTREYFYAAVRLGWFASRETDLVEHGSPSMELDCRFDLTDADTRTLADRLEREQPAMVARLRDLVERRTSETDPAAVGD